VNSTMGGDDIGDAVRIAVKRRDSSCATSQTRGVSAADYNIMIGCGSGTCEMTTAKGTSQTERPSSTRRTHELAASQPAARGCARRTLASAPARRTSLVASVKAHVQIPPALQALPGGCDPREPRGEGAPREAASRRPPTARGVRARAANHAIRGATREAASRRPPSARGVRVRAASVGSEETP
jgi:hypothetical protein